MKNISKISIISEIFYLSLRKRNLKKNKEKNPTQSRHRIPHLIVGARK